MPTSSEDSSLCDEFRAGGDVTLRSVDGVEFSVHALVLSLASPVLADMFSTAMQQSVVDVAETSEMLAFMLKSIYPLPPPPVSSFEMLRKGFHLADKYQLDSMKNRLRNELFVKTSSVSAFADPLRALALAIELGFDDVAKLATSVASESHNFRKTKNLVRLAEAVPSISPFVKMIGIPSARTSILISVLFRFHERPMSLFQYQPAGALLCSSCFATYYNSVRYSPPEWQARWANWVFQELNTRDISDAGDVFTLESFKVAVCKGEVPFPEDSCSCHIQIPSYKGQFEAWAAEVRRCLISRLKTLKPLDGLA
ncbi:hypothetical protein FRC07_009498 [Ceratobasidium sp. 392]|nr:hypothetical protein FRC07_009498 [Ceratobasidium sp. 392]